MISKSSIWAYSLSALAFSATCNAEPESVQFSHFDWEISCDNTRTCRAAGYHSDKSELGVSVLLTRKAGPNQTVTGLLALSEIETGRELPDFPAELSFHIDGLPLGKLKILESGDYQFSSLQVVALLKALRKDSSITFSSSTATWQLSGKGASATLLKMDEFQGRIGTSGALVKRGNKPEATTLPAIKKKTVTIPSLKNLTPLAINEYERKTLIGAMRKNSGEYCDELLEADNDDVDISIYPLSKTHSLVRATCWLAAYNAGSGWWLIENDNFPYSPTLINTDGNDYHNGIISASHKGRGIGDCWSYDSWAWNGNSFVKIDEYTTGMCKLIRLGGAWKLPTLVNDVKHVDLE